MPTSRSMTALGERRLRLSSSWRASRARLRSRLVRTRSATSGVESAERQKGGSDVAEDSAGVVRRFYDEVINSGRLDVVDELMAEDFVEHQEFPGLEPNRE